MKRKSVSMMGTGILISSRIQRQHAGDHLGTLLVEKDSTQVFGLRLYIGKAAAQLLCVLKGACIGRAHSHSQVGSSKSAHKVY